VTIWSPHMTQGASPGALQRVHADTADMSGCCDPRGCNDMFGPRFARYLASRYRKRGLDKTAARMVAYVVDRGVQGASVLEIGGGVGDIRLQNGSFRLKGKSFRTFAHPPAAMVAVAEGRGIHTDYS